MVARPLDFETPSPSVLITDDNDAWRDVVADVLSRVGFHTFEAACGEEALQVVRTRHLDVVLIDFHMPRLDGLQTLRLIRRHDRFLPAVLMTAHPADVPVAEVRALRVEGVLAKPAKRERIVTIVTQAVHWGF